MNDDQQLPELPEEIWRKVFVDLDRRDIKSFHLVSSQFHRAANTYPHKLRISIKKDDQKIASILGAINQSSRYFEAVTIFSGWSSVSLNYHQVEKFFQKFGDGVKFLKVNRVSISEQDLHKILELLPNLNSLEISSAKIIQEQEIERTAIDLPKLETVMILACCGDFSNILLCLKCKITKFDADGSGRSIYVLDKWQSTVKKLKISDSFLVANANVLFTLQFKCLEDLSFEFSFNCYNLDPLLQLQIHIFLGQHENLKHFDLNGKQLNNDGLLNAICENLLKLESLKILVSGTFSNASIRNISKLKCLRSLTLETDELDMVDLLNALNLEVNENFEEMKVISRRSIDHSRLPGNLSEKIPNLKKVDILTDEFHEMFCFFLKNFKRLEKFSAFPNQRSSGIIYTCKRLEIFYLENDFTYSKLENSGIFGSLYELEILEITCYHQFNDRGDLMQVLRHFPKLKKFIVIFKNVCGKGEFSKDVADLILQYGKNLREIEIPYRCNEEEVGRS